MNPVIKVIGVGGSGANTVSRMAKFSISSVELLAVNTDAQALHFSKASKKILIGKTYKEVQEILRNCSYRITQEDGKSYAITMDFNPNRYNLILENKIVIDVNFG